MLTSSLVGRSRPVGVLLGGSGVSRTILQPAPQVSALLLCHSRDRRNHVDPAISVDLRMEDGHDD